jgi:hypothetical protein
MGRIHKAVTAAVGGAVVLLMSQVPVAAAPAATGTVLHNGFSGYPRMVRLEHSGAANGRIIASVTGTLPSRRSGGVIFSSFDDGQTFTKIADVPDIPATAGTGVCCGTIYELPVQVGDMPEGTLLRAASVGNAGPDDKRQVRQRLWRSDDHGYTWSYVSDMAVAPPGNHYNAWEPELSVTGDGRLAAYYSDETDKARHDQKLVKVASSDGVHWTPPENLIIHKDRSVRPGMAVVRQLPDGTFFMAYEVCNNDLKHLCSIYTRKSADGWNWGDPYDLGKLVRTPDGKYARHTPSIAWSPGPGPDGTILLISEMLVNADGSVARGNGKTILGNDQSGNGTWYEMPSPVQIDGVDNSGCRNFSPSLLPTEDGTEVLQMATDYFRPNDCRTYFATGPLTHP